MAGEVPLPLQSGRRRAARGISMPTEPEEVQETAGLYRFDLQRPPRIPGHSTVTVPLPALHLSMFQQRAVLSVPFTTAAHTVGVFRRGFTFRASAPVLGGLLQVREQGYVVGQAVLSETAAEQLTALDLGRDPDVSFVRTLQRVDTNPVSGSNGITKNTLQTTYRLTYTVRNAKSRVVDLELGEQLPSTDGVLWVGDGRVAEGQLRFSGTLNAGESRHFNGQLVLETKAELK